MQPPQLLNDVINVLLLLAPAAAVVCLVLAGISLRYEGGGITFVLGVASPSGCSGAWSS